MGGGCAALTTGGHGNAQPASPVKPLLRPPRARDAEPAPRHDLRPAAPCKAEREVHPNRVKNGGRGVATGSRSSAVTRRRAAGPSRNKLGRGSQGSHLSRTRPAVGKVRDWPQPLSGIERFSEKYA